MSSEGTFFVVDGPEGCGKSTQVRMLRDHLEDRGHSVTTVRDPGGTPVGERIRKILLHPNISEISPKTEMFLYLASRTQLVKDRIRPALEEGDIVISDRFFSSTFAYQGIAGGVGEDVVTELNEVATEGLEPEVLFLLDLPVEDGRERLEEEDRMEGKTEAYHRRVREGFSMMRNRYPERVISIDARQSIQEIGEKIVSEAKTRLSE